MFGDQHRRAHVDRDAAVARHVRVGVAVGGRAVRGPAGVADAEAPGGRALAEVIAAFPIYRTYIADAVTAEDRRYIEWAVARAWLRRELNAP